MSTPDIRSRILDSIHANPSFPVPHRRDVEVFFRDAVPVLGEMGFFGLLIPPEYGGMGLTTREYVVAVETIAEYDPMAAYTINEHSTIGSLALVRYGTPQQKEAYLPRLARGEILGAFGLTEPNHGSDVTTVDTRAVQEKGGWVLTGKKLHISLSAHAGLFHILAGVEQDGGLEKALFLVEGNHPNLFHGEENSSPAGYLIPGAGSVILERCWVPENALLGVVGQGAAMLRDIFDVARVGLAAVYVGASQRALERSVHHAKTRVAFGQPIANRQAIQFKLADMRIATQAARLLVRDAASRIDEGASWASLEAAAIAKVFTTEMAQTVGAEAVQIHGGSAFLADPPVDWYLRDAKMGDILGGTSEVMRLLISKQVLGMRETS